MSEQRPLGPFSDAQERDAAVDAAIGAYERAVRRDDALASPDRLLVQGRRGQVPPRAGAGDAVLLEAPFPLDLGAQVQRHPVLLGDELLLDLREGVVGQVLLGGLGGPVPGAGGVEGLAVAGVLEGDDAGEHRVLRRPPAVAVEPRLLDLELGSVQ